MSPGALAQKRGVENAGRLVSSAKSWLSHTGVDRTAPLLPYNAPEGVRKISPVEASRRYLEHLRNAWDTKMPDAPFNDAAGAGDRAGIVRCGGARVDQRRRDEAGYKNVIAARGAAGRVLRLDRAAQGLARARQVGRPDSGRGYRRRHHGFHADRRDRAATANCSWNGWRWASTSCWAATTSIWRWRALVAQLAGGKGHEARQRCSCRRCGATAALAKEKLLDPGAKAEEPVTILGKGTGLVGGTIKATLHRDDVERSCCDGFLPGGRQPGHAARQRRVGLQEIGLPYAADAAITRHMARFLRQQAATAEHGAVRRGPSGLACPTHILFNGGVLRAGIGSGADHRGAERVARARRAWMR